MTQHLRLSGKRRSYGLGGAGIALLVSLSCPAADKQPPAPAPQATASAHLDSDGVQRATLLLDSYRFTPQVLIVRAGKPVELTLKNVAAVVPHDFVLDADAADLHVKQNVAAGGSAQLRFTPTVPGRYEFHCDKKLLFFKSHRDKGMNGFLEVRG